MDVSWTIRKAGEGEVAQSCPTICDPIDCSLPGSSVHGIFQAIVLEWVAIFFSIFLHNKAFIKSQKDESERDSGVVNMYGESYRGRSVSGEGMDTALLPTPLTPGISSIWLFLSCILL